MEDQEKPELETLWDKEFVCNLFRIGSEALWSAGMPIVKLGKSVRFSPQQIRQWCDEHLNGETQDGLPDKYLTPLETQVALGIRRRPLNTLRKKGEIGHLRISSNTVRYDPREVRSYIERQTKRIAS